MQQIPNTPGGYSVIYADPPWTYNDKATPGKRGVAFKYPTMSLDELKNMGVRQVAGKDCACFMWATFPLLSYGMELLSSWGFTYKTVAFVWVKTYAKSGKDFFGMGSWTRANAEIVLLGVKGKPKRVAANVRQVYRGPILRHSEKPAEIRQRITSLMGEGPKLELFSRHNISGWDRFGNELLP